LAWDAENRLVQITQGTSVSTFIYDGDGNRVQATVDGVTTTYIGGYYEWRHGTTQRKYYYHGGQRVAMREGGVTTWLLGDHLGSSSVSCRQDGQTTRQQYHAWGTIRPGPGNALPTD
jgi:YD repeat-containing protein